MMVASWFEAHLTVLLTMRHSPGADTYSVQWRLRRIFSWMAAASVNVGTGLLTIR